MRLLTTAALPSSLLSLLALLLPPSYQQESWPAPAQEDTPLLSPRDAEICQKLQTQAPIALRKMSSHDPGEMFYISDWQFDDNEDPNSSTNSSSSFNLPILLHGSASSAEPLRRPLSRLLRPRATDGFSCPSNTNSCASIGADYGCCPQGTTCQIDSKGNLGCCPGSAGTCTGNTPTGCEDGYSSCSLFHGGGGCCAQGFDCQSQGCVGVSTTVVVVYPTVTVSRAASTSSSIEASTTTTTISSTSTSTSTSISSTSSTSTTIDSTTTTESDDPSLSTPIAATSLSLTTSTTLIPTTEYIGPCPTGYYACSAVFAAGACCQIGRDCGRTSCPPLVTSTALVSNGVTIADVTASGLCATGWSTCGSDVGGGCCPGGYACGTQLCSATTTGPQASLGSAVAKEGSSDAARSVMSWALGWGLGLSLMVVLIV